jgi:hypothetical protein
MESSEADRLTPIAESAMMLCQNCMQLTHLLEYYAVADDGFGFGYTVADEKPEVRIIVDWHGKRVMQILVDTTPGEPVRPWLIQPFDNGGDDSWIEVLRASLAKLQGLTQRAAPGVTRH